MAFSAIMSIWPTSAEYYNLLRVVQNPAGTDVSIEGELSPSLKTEMRAVLMQLCGGTTTMSGRASIILDALDDLVVTDLEDNVITSQAQITDANTKVTLRIAGPITRTNRTVVVVMPQTLIGVYSGTTASPGDILLQTGVVPGTYTNATITVRADGRVAVASSGLGGAGGTLGAGSITTSYLADGAVTDAKIADVDAAKVTGLADVATSGDYADLTGTPDLSGYLDTSSVLSSSNLGSNIVTTAKIADGTVTTAKIALNAVTDAKIAGVSAAKVTGLAAVATSGSYNDLSDTPQPFSGAYSDLTGTPDLTNYVTASTVSSTYATKTDLALAQQAVFYKQACATRVSSVSAASTYLAANQSARVLVDSGTAAVNNGIYVYDATAGYKRAADFDGDPVSEVSPGAMVYVNDASIAYVCNSSSAPTVVNGVITGTTSWAIYSKAEVLTASNGISRSGNALSLDTTAATFKTAVPYDIALDFAGRPTLNEVMLEFTLPRAMTLAAPAAHYVKTLVSGERPATNNGSVLTVYRNATAVLTISYQTTGVAVVAEPGSTVRSFSAGDVLKVTCTTYDSTAKNHKATLCASLN